MWAGGVFRATLCVAWVVRVKPFPPQGCLTPPSHCVATQQRWTLYSLWWEEECSNKHGARSSYTSVGLLNNVGPGHTTRGAGGGEIITTFHMLKTTWKQHLPIPVWWLSKTTNTESVTLPSSTEITQVAATTPSSTCPLVGRVLLRTHGVRWLLISARSRYTFAQSKHRLVSPRAYQPL